MRGLNKVMLIGRLGKDPEMIFFESGVAKASFTLATNEIYRDRDGNKIEKTDWHNVVMWRKLAEISGKYLKKGSRVYIEGKLKTRSWDDRDGNKRYITEVEAIDMHMLDTKQQSQGYANGENQGGSNNSQNQMQSNGNGVNGGNGTAQTQVAKPVADDEDDLPF